jgi:predicted HicB family RNase H-like nuclease
MTITPTPKRSSAKPAPARDQERREAEFIEAAAPRSQPSRKTVVQIRLAPALLEQIDREAQRRGLSRSSWIQYTLSEHLDQAGSGRTAGE